MRNRARGSRAKEARVRDARTSKPEGTAKAPRARFRASIIPNNPTAAIASECQDAKSVADMAKLKRSRLTRAWNAFRKQHGSKRGRDVSREEIEMLSQVALMGEVRDPRDFDYILSKLRSALRR